MDCIFFQRNTVRLSVIQLALIDQDFRCELVDFDYKNSFGGNEAVMRWIVNHFSPAVAPRAPNATEALMADTIIWTTRMPVILQDGLHSRSVVGFEEVDDNTINLLVFDPSRCAVPNLGVKMCLLRTSQYPQVKASTGGDFSLKSRSP